MTPVQKAVEALIQRHGGLRSAARARGLDPTYLSRLRAGSRCNPSARVLKILGLIKTVEYRKEQA